jgi:diacylglycerol kinase
MNWLKGRFVYAFAGLHHAIVHDKSIRLQFIFMLMAMAASFVLRCSKEEWLWILLSCALVLSAEFFNSCIEKCVDYISLERNPQAKIIKDMAAAAVLIVSLFALCVALLILLPKLLKGIK